MPVHIGLEETEQDFPTPEWIREHCVANGGGWAIPTLVGLEHPVVAEKWPCFHCDEVFEAGDVVIPMPWGGGRDPEDKARWIAEHRECMVTGIIEDPAERAKSLPMRVISYGMGYDRAWLERGDVVTVTDPNLFIVDQVALVDSIVYREDATILVTVRILEDAAQKFKKAGP